MDETDSSSKAARLLSHHALRAQVADVGIRGTDAGGTSIGGNRKPL